MKALAKFLIVAGLPLLVSHFVRPMNVDTAFEGSQAAKAFRPPNPAARPTDNVTPDYFSKEFAKKVPDERLNLQRMDAFTEKAESRLKKLSDDRASTKTFITITDARLNWASDKVRVWRKDPYIGAIEHAVYALKRAIQEESKAYRALARGHLPEAYDRIARAAEGQEFAYLVKFMLQHRSDLLPFAYSIDISHNLDFSSKDNILKATKNLEAQKKAYESIPSRQQLGAVIHHFNQLDYPAEELLPGSVLLRDRLHSSVLGQSHSKSYLERSFKKAAMKAQNFGNKAIGSLEENDRVRAMQLINELSSSRKRASDYYSRYQQNGHGTIDLTNDPELKQVQSTVLKKLQNVQGSSEEIPKFEPEKLKKLLARIALY